MGNRGGIGSHTKQVRVATDVWLTPKPILWALGKFDLDPCAAPRPRPWPTASEHYERTENGLHLPWWGRVWLNPPYGNDVGLWMELMAKHSCGIAMVFARTETEWWRDWVWPFAKALLFIYGRINFCLPDGSVSQYNAGGPTVLIAYSGNDADHLYHCGIRGALVKVQKP